MQDPRIETVRSSIDEFRRSRKGRSEGFPETLKSRILGLLDRHTVPQLAKRIGVSHVSVYQWKRELAASSAKIDSTDPFVELPVELSMEHLATEPANQSNIIEISRRDRSATMRIECSAECMGLLLREFLAGAPTC